jgi:hypothetical protein
LFKQMKGGGQFELVLRIALLAVVAASAAVVPLVVGASAVPTTRARAEHAAKEVLAQFRVPPGSRSVSTPPRGTNPNILAPIPLGHGAFGSPYLVDRHRYFLVPGTAQAIAGWMAVHPPAGWSGLFNGRCRAATAGKRCLMVFGHANTGDFKGLDPQLLVKTIQIAGHRSVVRVDTDFAWFGPKNQFDSIPPGATVMTVAAAGPKNRVLRTIRDEGSINAFRTRIDSLRAFPPNQACTANLVGPPYLYSFKTTARAAPFAMVFVDLSGCTTVDVEVRGHPGTELIGSAGLQHHLP